MQIRMTFVGIGLNCAPRASCHLPEGGIERLKTHLDPMIRGDINRIFCAPQDEVIAIAEGVVKGSSRRDYELVNELLSLDHASDAPERAAMAGQAIASRLAHEVGAVALVLGPAVRLPLVVAHIVTAFMRGHERIDDLRGLSLHGGQAFLASFDTGSRHFGFGLAN